MTKHSCDVVLLKTKLILTLLAPKTHKGYGYVIELCSPTKFVNYNDNNVRPRNINSILFGQFLGVL